MGFAFGSQDERRAVCLRVQYAEKRRTFRRERVCLIVRWIRVSIVGRWMRPFGGIVFAGILVRRIS